MSWPLEQPKRQQKGFVKYWMPRRGFDLQCWLLRKDLSPLCW